MLFSPENAETKKRKNGYRIFLFLSIFFASTLLAVFLWSSQAFAATGINKKISFQGKVVNTDGTNVTNGSYDFVFKLYTVSSGGTAAWTETWNSGTSQVTVTDGIFQVDLGTHTTLPGSIDFNTDNIYLGVEFNGDGEMSPRVHFTAAPYAFNAKTVGGLTVTDTTGTLTIPDGKTISFAEAFTTSGAFATTLTATGTTNVTLPTTGTLATLAGSETLTNKTIGSTGLTFSGAATDITTASGESLVVTAAGAGTIDLQDAVTADSLTLDSGGLTLQNSEVIGNGTDDLITFGGAGGADNTDLYLDLDGTSPVLYSNTDVRVSVEDYLNVQVSGVTGAAAGDIWYDSAANKFKINENGTTKVLCNTTDAGCGSGGVTADSLDFIDFEDTLDLDAALTLNQTTNTWSQSFTGTTTTGYTYAANSLTSGSAYTIGSSAAASFTGSLVNISLSDGTGASSNTGSLLAITNSGTANANTSLYLKHYATGTNNLAFRIDDESGDTTPFVIDGQGWVGIGTSTPTGPLQIEGGAAPADTTGADITINAQDSTGPTASQGGNISIVPGNGAGGYATGYITLGPMTSAMYIDRNGGDSYASSGSGQNPPGITVVTANGWSLDDNASIYSYGVQNANGNHQNAYIGTVSITGAGVYTPALVFGQSTGSNAYAERMRLDENGNFGIGDLSPASLFTVGSGDLFQINSSGQIAAAAGITSSGTITFSSISGSTQCLHVNSSGVVTGTGSDCGSGGTADLQTTYGYDADGSNATISLTAADDGLVFTNPTSGGTDTASFLLQLTQQNTTATVVTLDLTQSSNAANGMNVTANSIDTETGLALTTNGLTSGSGMTVSSSSTAFTGNLAGITLSGSNAANTGNVLAVSNTGALNTNTTLFVDHRATGTNNLAVRVDDQSGDTTPFVIDGTGQVGIGTSAPARALDVFQAASAPQLRISKDLTNYSEVTVDSVGDLNLNATGNDITATSENLWVCDNDACPALTLTGQGNIFIENVLKFGNGVYLKNDSATELSVYDNDDNAMLIFDEL